MDNDGEEAEKCEEPMEVEDTDSSDDEDDILENRAKELELEVSKNPYAYNTHVDLVGIYKKLLNLDEMRNAYERFYKYYPLTGQLWLDWIKDEIRVANTENEKNNIIKLFDKAVGDYLSVDLWLEYVQFGIGFDSDKTRQIFEKAINAAGLHFMKGSLIWDAYREYELAILSVITDIESEAWKQQVLKVNEIFKRQLSVPLMEMERTFIEWRVWLERLPQNDFIDKEPVNWAYKNSTKYLTDYLEFEDKLAEAEDEKKLQIYRNYIDDNRKPELIRCLYERAVADFCLNGELWLEYCMYYFKLDNFDAAISTCGRALRNCYDAELWVLNLRLLEIAGKSHDEITLLLEKALSYQLNGETYLQIWLAYMDHFRRITNQEKSEEVQKIRDAFDRGHKYLIENFGFEIDPECSFLRFWAKIEASFLKDITNCRKIWNEYGILRILGSSVYCWLELLNLEQQYGDDKHIRKTYQRALSSVKDWPQLLVQHWIVYERQFGTIESVISSTEYCRKFMKKWYLDHPNSSEEIKETKRNEQQNERKRKNEQRNSMEKQQKQVKTTDESSENKNGEKEFHKIEIGSEKQQRSVFVSNLDYSVTEDQLKEFLGPVEELRIVKNRQGVSRGYAYCIFSTIGEAQITLKRDREQLNGRPVFISKCNVDKTKREHNFNYATSRENNKLFVRGLPLNMSQEEVGELFKTHGDIEQVRLVTFKNGRSKGLAYIDFKNADDAKKAILAIDNTDVEGCTISVAISDPPKRKFESGPQVAPPRHAKNRLQIPLVPRAVQTKALTQTPPSSSAMTNEDFRKLLTKN